MVAHGFVDIQIGRARSVKASQQFVHHNQQLHLRRLILELLFDALLKLGEFFISEHPLVYFLFVFFFAFLREIGGSCSDTLRSRLVGSHDGAFGKAHAHEYFPILAGFIDAARHEHSRTAVILKPRFQTHIKHDIGRDFLQPLL